MILSEIQLKGYRNFRDATMSLAEKTLIIGANDIGKSNMLRGMRLLLDRGFSELDVEPKDYDFYCHEPVNELSISIKFTGVTEDCVLARLPGKVSDGGELMLSYKAWKDTLTYAIFAGPSEDKLEEISDRFYRKAFHLRYISSNRDLGWYVKKEKRNLLNDAKAKRDEGEAEADKLKLNEIAANLDEANEKIAELAYVKKSTEAINGELEQLSFHHTSTEIVFDVGAADLSSFVDNLNLVSKVNATNLAIGGDGRNNQIFLALWAARNEIKEENPLEIAFYCIEEPEAHLHPHQQRKLAEYLIRKLKGQVFITSHSPQIASEFSPNSIVRLVKKGKFTKAANGGCSKIIEDAVYEFGYRLNAISAEAFFANAVLLVEGPSEILFYRVLAKYLDIDLDRFNISVLVANGIGFSTYITILQALEIEWVVRTDNDVFKVSRRSAYRMAGVLRAISLYEKHTTRDKQTDALVDEIKEDLGNMPDPAPAEDLVKKINKLRQKLEEYDIFLSVVDLENDLLDQGLLEDVKGFLTAEDREECLEIMVSAKATFMYSFLYKNSKSLKKLGSCELVKPIIACKNLVQHHDKAY
jgi:putative ATP-dependent endonuclease of OLD family